MMAAKCQVFVSYGREESVKKFVRKLKIGLETEQLSVWLDEEDIPAGTEWPKEIRSALRECKALIPVVTKKYVSSQYCKSELYVAHSYKKPIFPIIREDGWNKSDDGEAVMFLIAAGNWAMFRPVDDFSISWEKLVAGLKGIEGGKELMSFPEEPENEVRTQQGNHVISMMPDGKATWEYETLFANQAVLADQLADTPGIAVRLSNELFARKIICKAVRDEANIRGPQVTEIMRVQPILTALLAKIDLNPKRYHELRTAMLVSNVGVDSDVVDRFVPEKGLLDEAAQSSTMPGTTADHKHDTSTQKKKCRINLQSLRFVELILKLSSILASDPESEALALRRMKLSLATLKGQDESTAIDPEVYQGTTTVEEFFEVMSKYWPCYADHELLTMVIEMTENKEAIDALKCFLQSNDPGTVIPVANSGRSLELPPKRESLVAEISLDYITCGMYKYVKGMIASALKTPNEALSLLEVVKGSCILVWHVSEEIAAGIKTIQLSPDDQEMLLQCAVTKMSCGEECLFSKRLTHTEQEMVTSGMIPELVETVSELEGGEGGEVEPEIQGRVRAITSDEDFERELKQVGESLVVVDFKADWCVPSLAMNPKFAALSEQYTEAKFLSVNAEKCEATAVRYNVVDVPTFAFFRKRQLLYQVVGADIQAVELGILQAESPVPGQISLNSLINKTGSECLNENDSHPFKNALTAGEEYLESDCDEQLIVSLTFQMPVKLHTLQIVGPPDGRAPKRVKLFINQIHTLDFDSAEQRKAVQEFDLTEDDVKQDSLLSLVYVKFQNVQNLTVFIQDNQGGEETTVVNHIDIFGSPLDSINMKQFQRVSGVKGEIHVKGFGGCW